MGTMTSATVFPGALFLLPQNISSPNQRANWSIHSFHWNSRYFRRPSEGITLMCTLLETACSIIRGYLSWNFPMFCEWLHGSHFVLAFKIQKCLQLETPDIHSCLLLVRAYICGTRFFVSMLSWITQPNGCCVWDCPKAGAAYL